MACLCDVLLQALQHGYAHHVQRLMVTGLFTLLLKNPRMALQVKNVARLSDSQRQAVTQRVQAIRRGEVGAVP